MQSFSIVHWMVFVIPLLLLAGALFLFVTAIISRKPDDRSVRESSGATPVSKPSGGTATLTAGPSGIHGWLVLLAIGVFLTPIVTIVSLVQTGDFQYVASSAVKYPLIYVAEIALFLALFVLQSCTALFMARRSRRFVTFYVVTGIATILFKPVNLLVSIAIVALSMSVPFLALLQRYVADNSTADEMAQWISMSISLVIWTIYVLRSRRVARPRGQS